MSKCAQILDELQGRAKGHLSATVCELLLKRHGWNLREVMPEVLKCIGSAGDVIIIRAERPGWSWTGVVPSPKFELVPVCVKQAAEPPECCICEEADADLWALSWPSCCKELGAHAACAVCWLEYLKTALEGGKGCGHGDDDRCVSCPFPNCGAPITRSGLDALMDAFPQVVDGGGGGGGDAASGGAGRRGGSFVAGRGSRGKRVSEFSTQENVRNLAVLRDAEHFLVHAIRARELPCRCPDCRSFLVAGSHSEMTYGAAGRGGTTYSQTTVGCPRLSCLYVWCNLCNECVVPMTCSHLSNLLVFYT